MLYYYRDKKALRVKCRVFIFSVILCMSACTTTKTTVTTTSDHEITQQRLSGEWSLEQLMGRQITEEKYMNDPYLRLDPQAKKVTGNSSCNGFSGNITLKGDTLTFDEVIATKMYCEKSVEKEFMEVLHRTDRYVLKGTQLYLFGEGEALARFLKK